MFRRYFLLALLATALANPMDAVLGQTVLFTPPVLDTSGQFVGMTPVINPENSNSPIIQTPVISNPSVPAPVVPNLSITPNGPMNPGSLQPDSTPLNVEAVRSLAFPR